MSVNQTEGKITALYERLSRDDDNAGDSNSIVNQKKYLEGYAAQRGYSNCVHYTDDGWSGGNFERPAWKKLVEDIEAGKVAHVIVKDMSRIGGTTYKVRVVFNESGGETMEDKILRIVRNDMVTNDGTYGIMEAPQMSRQSERSAS